MLTYLQPSATRTDAITSEGIPTAMLSSGKGRGGGNGGRGSKIKHAVRFSSMNEDNDDDVTAMYEVTAIEPSDYDASKGKEKERTLYSSLTELIPMQQDDIQDSMVVEVDTKQEKKKQMMKKTKKDNEETKLTMTSAPLSRTSLPVTLLSILPSSVSIIKPIPLSIPSSTSSTSFKSTTATTANVKSLTTMKKVIDIKTKEEKVETKSKPKSGKGWYYVTDSEGEEMDEEEKVAVPMHGKKSSLPIQGGEGGGGGEGEGEENMEIITDVISAFGKSVDEDDTMSTTISTAVAETTESAMLPRAGAGTQAGGMTMMMIDDTSSATDSSMIASILQPVAEKTIMGSYDDEESKKTSSSMMMEEEEEEEEAEVSPTVISTASGITASNNRSNNSSSRGNIPLMRSKRGKEGLNDLWML
jgi:hypothetical protein